MDFDDKFYQRVADEIYSCTNIDGIPHIIENYLSHRPSKHNQAYYYIRLIELLLLNKSYVSIFKPTPNKKEIIANFNGIIIYKNEEAPAHLPFLILADNNILKSELQKNDYSVIYNKRKFILAEHSDALQEIKRERPIGDAIQTAITINFNIGEEIKKGDVLCVYTYFKLSDIAKSYKQKFEVAKQFCDTRIKTLPKYMTEKNKVNHKELQLIDIWQGDDYTYKFVIEKLHDDWKQIGGPFVFTSAGVLKWMEDLRRDRNTWLAAFMSACQHNGYILKKEENGNCFEGKHYYKSVATLVSILKTTFSLETLDDEQFLKRLKGKEFVNDRFSTPFETIF